MIETIDPLGRMIAVRRGDGGRVALTYDEGGQVTSHTDVLGRTTRWV